MTLRITGHRGALAVAPENTMRSFQAAVDAGVDEIELDVHLSVDGYLVVIHDETLDRTTDGSGPVSAHTWAEIAVLDAGLGERVPQLDEVLDRFPDTAFQIEVKAAAATAAVLDAVRERGDRGGAIVITSFLPEAIAPALTGDRTWRVGLICGRNEPGKPDLAEELGVDQLYLHWDVAAAPVIAGRPVYVWPCNDVASVRRAADEGFAGLTTDDPAGAVAARAALRPA
ncbi:glycerophosphodiester phosphodiesterase family protein [Agromyces sp. G08B096]|uniref:Glycerophosphodiester phosphodiesterase family protein n=1 Tax=Agromyces sp. G08B096 TaxID=3156399 RepID=A0AAU7W4D6_9MICO